MMSDISEQQTVPRMKCMNVPIEIYFVSEGHIQGTVQMIKYCHVEMTVPLLGYMLHSS